MQTQQVPVAQTGAQWMCPFQWKITDDFGQPVASDGDNSSWAVAVLAGTDGVPSVLHVWIPDGALVGNYKVTWRGWKSFVWLSHLFGGAFNVGSP